MSAKKRVFFTEQVGAIRDWMVKIYSIAAYSWEGELSRIGLFQLLEGEKFFMNCHRSSRAPSDEMFLVNILRVKFILNGLNVKVNSHYDDV